MLLDFRLPAAIFLTVRQLGIWFFLIGREQETHESYKLEVLGGWSDVGTCRCGCGPSGERLRRSVLRLWLWLWFRLGLLRWLRLLVVLRPRRLLRHLLGQRLVSWSVPSWLRLRLWLWLCLRMWLWLRMRLWRGLQLRLQSMLWRCPGDGHVGTIHTKSDPRQETRWRAAVGNARRAHTFGARTWPSACHSAGYSAKCRAHTDAAEDQFVLD